MRLWLPRMRQRHWLLLGTLLLGTLYFNVLERGALSSTGGGVGDMALLRPLVRRPIMPDYARLCPISPQLCSLRSGFTLAPQNKQLRHVIISPGAHEQQNRLKRLAKRRK